MDISDKVKRFKKRWDVSFDENHDLETFKNRILYSLDHVLGNFFIQFPEYSDQFAYFAGSRSLPKSSTSLYNQKLNELAGKNFYEDPTYKYFTNANSITDIVFGLQYVFWSLETGNKNALAVKEYFVREVGQAISLSPSLNIKLATRKGLTSIYPSGAKLLDEGLVNDNLIWLEGYPAVLKYFDEALRIYATKDLNKYRNLLDNLRFALEQLLRSVLQNKKPIEKQKESMLSWLKSHRISQQVIDMYNELLFQKYTLYQNELVKHGDKWSPTEIEFIIYLTGTFMRLVVQLNESNAQT